MTLDQLRKAAGLAEELHQLFRDSSLDDDQRFWDSDIDELLQRIRGRLITEETAIMTRAMTGSDSWPPQPTKERTSNEET